VDYEQGVAILATRQAAQLEWLSHAVKGLGFDFISGRAPTGEARQLNKPKDVGYKNIQPKI
jgi:hypothetical protein